MKSRNIIITASIVIMAAVALYAIGVRASEGEIPQSGDLCGGTGGNGEIVSVASNTFTLKLNEGGQKGGGTLIVNLTSQATIETPTGYVSVSDLKTGDRVTLVGAG